MEDNPQFFEMLIRPLMSLGTSAVLVFFFLSGYLVGGNELERLHSGGLQPRKYLVDRISRLWLVLIPALVFTFALNSISCNPNKVSLYCSSSLDLASHADGPPLLDQNLSSFLGSILFLQPFQGNVFGGNGPLWSLSYEFWYYIVFYFVILVISSIRTNKFPKSLILFFLLFLSGLSILSFDWFTLGTVWIAGAISKTLVNQLDKKTLLRNQRFLQNHKIFKIIIFLVFPAMISVKLLPRFAFSFPPLVLLLIIAIAISNNKAMLIEEKFFNKLIVRGSEISFSLYIIHFPLLALISTYVTPVLRWEFGLGSVTFVAIMVSLSLVIAYLFAFFTELKLFSLRKRLRFLYGK
jgi:peptidoglycan/LPS O-acetylase OafA/YrhL